MNIGIVTNTRKKYFYIIVKNLYRRSSDGWNDVMVYTKFSVKLCLCIYGLCVRSVPVHCSVMPSPAVHNQFPTGPIGSW